MPLSLIHNQQVKRPLWRQREERFTIKRAKRNTHTENKRVFALRRKRRASFSPRADSWTAFYVRYPKSRKMKIERWKWGTKKRKEKRRRRKKKRKRKKAEMDWWGKRDNPVESIPCGSSTYYRSQSIDRMSSWSLQPKRKKRSDFNRYVGKKTHTNN